MLNKSRKNDNIIVYLAGPIEYTEDNGIGWRIAYSGKLATLGIKCIVPNYEEAEIIPDPVAFIQLKKDNYQAYKEVTRRIIKKDLDFVHSVDFLITRWDGERMAGTVGEAQEAYLYAKCDNFLVTPRPFHEIPGWFGACMTDEFHTLDELINYFNATNYLAKYRRK